MRFWTKVDKELEKRGLVFCRYAEDLNAYTRSKQAAEDAMQTLRGLLTPLPWRPEHRFGSLTKKASPREPRRTRLPRSTRWHRLR
jgi:hypothetical protein